jgi:hypothetical protein
MKPVNQTILDFEHGNCMQACVASILELPLEDVPNFMQDGPDQFNFHLDKFCLSLNLTTLDVVLENNNLDLIENCYVIATGKSPRGTEAKHRHAVVWFNGEIIHDPHPSRSGLVGDPESYTLFVLHNPALFVQKDSLYKLL